MSVNKLKSQHQLLIKIRSEKMKKVNINIRNEIKRKKGNRRESKTQRR